MAGYLGTQPVPQATQNRQAFTATASQTSFATIGYTPQYLDVYLNGVHLLNGTDYTATNGSDVVLTTGAASGDVLEVVSYSTYEVNSQNYTGGLTVDNDGATVLTVDRATTDGTVIDVQKGGSTVGSIGSTAGVLTVGNATTGGVIFGYNAGHTFIEPSNASGASTDDLATLGSGGRRFRDLYLSGGVYLGGTGSANKLDDVEFGDWTPTVFSGGGGFSGTVSVNHARYRKIGRTVWVDAYISVNVSAVGSGDAKIGGLPFTVQGGYSPFKAVHGDLALSNGGYFNNGDTTMTFIYDNSVSGRPIAGTGVRKVMISGHYDT